MSFEKYGGTQITQNDLTQSWDTPKTEFILEFKCGTSAQSLLDRKAQSLQKRWSSALDLGLPLSPELSRNTKHLW